VTFEESTVGWVILHANTGHSDHAVAKPRELSEAELEVTHSKWNSKIPDQLIDSVSDDIMLLRPTVEAIHHFIDKKAKQLNIAIVWVYNDVYNIFKTTLEEKVYDATHLVELLQKRKDELGLDFKLRHGQDGRLVQVFFEMVRDRSGVALCTPLPHSFGVDCAR
jgi:hypothetical protein